MGGGRFDGGWRDDQMQGRGVFTMPSGALVEGEWEAGVLRGAATLRAATSGSELYVGELAEVAGCPTQPLTLALTPPLALALTLSQTLSPTLTQTLALTPALT